MDKTGHHGDIGHSKELKWFNITYCVSDREFIKLVKTNSYIGALTLYEKIRKDNYELVDISVMTEDSFELPDS